MKQENFGFEYVCQHNEVPLFRKRECDKAMTNYKGANWQTLILGKSKKPHNYTMRLVIVCLEASVSTLVQ
jgi:hypothetical protein